MTQMRLAAAAATAASLMPSLRRERTRAENSRLCSHWQHNGGKLMLADGVEGKRID